MHHQIVGDRHRGLAILSHKWSKSKYYDWAPSCCCNVSLSVQGRGGNNLLAPLFALNLNLVDRGCIYGRTGWFPSTVSRSRALPWACPRTVFVRFVMSSWRQHHGTARVQCGTSDPRRPRDQSGSLSRNVIGKPNKRPHVARLCGE